MSTRALRGMRPGAQDLSLVSGRSSGGDAVSGGGAARSRGREEAAIKGPGVSSITEPRLRLRALAEIVTFVGRDQVPVPVLGGPPPPGHFSAAQSSAGLP